MAILQNSIVAATPASEEDVVTRSLRFNGSNSRLSNTFSSNGDRKMWTLSFWAKGNFTATALASSVPNSSSGQYYSTVKVYAFSASVSFQFTEQYGSNVQTNVTAAHSSNGELRDPSSWYHWTVHYDSAESSQTDRVRAYLNGKRLTLSFAGSTLGQNRDGNINRQNFPHSIGSWDYAYNSSTNIQPYKDYMADYYFVDGANVDPVGNFIEDNGYGNYKPKAYDMSSHGGNSFHLKFENSSSIGEDSANSNDFTATNLASHDVMLDVPYPKNYATLNPLQKAGTNGSDPAKGNLSLTGGSNPSKAFSSTIAANSGKYYAEFFLSSLGYPSVSVSDTSLWVPNYGSGRVEGNGSITYDVRAATGSGQYFINSTSGGSALSITPSAGDIIQVAFDVDTRKVWFGRNGTWNGSGNPANGTNHVGVVGGTDALTVVLRSESGTTIAGFGADPTFAGNKTSGQDTSQSEFYYAPPSGFKSLNTSNLDDPTVKPHLHFGVSTYSGTGSATTVSTDFQPDLVWAKRRDSAANHVLTDSVRGANKALSSNTTSTEDSSTSLVTAFNSASFGVGTDSKVNASGGTYVGWHWKESASAGFDVVTWTGNSEDYNGSSSVQSVSHSLGVAPEMIVAKNRTDDSAYAASANGNLSLIHI